MKKNCKNWILTLVASSAILVTACSSKEMPTQSATSPKSDQPAVANQTPQGSQDAQQQAQTKIAPVVSKPIEITGKVEQTDAGIVISTNVIDYHVAGPDLTAMIGKVVKATGAVQETQDKYTITIRSITEVDSQQ